MAAPGRLERRDEAARRTSSLLAAAKASVVLVESRIAKLWTAMEAETGCRCLTLEGLPSGQAEQLDVDGEDLALIQFSSGTTVEPKPVALSHRAVMSQAAILNSYWPDGDGVRHTGACWLPLHHDMGLIGCVFPALERPSELTLLSPDVLCRPPGPVAPCDLSV